MTTLLTAERYWLVWACEGGESWHPIATLPDLPLHRIEEELDRIENSLPPEWSGMRLERIGRHQTGGQ